MLEKKSKGLAKEKEALLCKCEVLQTEIQQLKEQNVRPFYASINSN